MKTQLPFPHALNWTAQDIADAVPLRLFEMFAYDADKHPARDAGNVTNAASSRRDWRHREYLSMADLPTLVRIR